MPADDSHEISSLFGFLKVAQKFEKVDSLTLWVKFEILIKHIQCQISQRWPVKVEPVRSYKSVSLLL